MIDTEKEMWVRYLGGGFGDEEDFSIECGVSYKVLRETETCYIVENMIGEEIPVYKYKFELADTNKVT
ncbi:MAG: hypothetical protein ACI35O_04040 [Bacillaceae bacterium]